MLRCKAVLVVKRLLRAMLTFTLLMVCVEMSFIGWFWCGVCLDGFKWIILGNEVGRNGFYINAGWDGLGWVEIDTLCKTMAIYKCQSRVMSWNLKLKILCSHYKISSKLIEICWRRLSMTSSYSMQSSVARTICGPHIKSRILKIKPHIHTIKCHRNWLKFVGDDSVWLTATMCKAVWLELHVDPMSGVGPWK